MPRMIYLEESSMFATAMCFPVCHLVKAAHINLCIICMQKRGSIIVNVTRVGASNLPILSEKQVTLSFLQTWFGCCEWAKSRRGMGLQLAVLLEATQTGSDGPRARQVCTNVALCMYVRNPSKSGSSHCFFSSNTMQDFPAITNGTNTNRRTSTRLHTSFSF